MRKVTASAVILTALTGCGQNSGIPSTQWSFEIPAEDEISSLALDQDIDAAAETTLVSAADSSVFAEDSRGNAVAGRRIGASSKSVMGPAFEQPNAVIDTGSADSSAATSLRSNRSELNLLGAESYRSVASSGMAGGYQPVATRPDPVAEVKAFLSAHGSPSALTNREPYRSNVVTPALPAVYLPSTPADITATLGDPTGMNAQVATFDSGSFTGAGLPIVESSSGGVYSIDNSASADLLAAASTPENPIYQTVSHSSITEVAAVPSSAAPLNATPLNAAPLKLNASNNAESIGQWQSSSIGEDGLPRLEPSRTQAPSIGTAILQDLQAEAIVQAASAEPAQELSPQVAVSDRLENASISIDITPIEADAFSADEPGQDLVADASQVSNYRTTEASSNTPMLEDLQSSVLDRDVSPLVAYALPTGEADLAVEAIAISTPQPSFPTLESLLETMPETAAQPNLAVELSEMRNNDAVSPLLEGLGYIEPLSTLYIPIPEATSENGSENGLENGVAATASTNESLVRASLESLSENVSAVRPLQDSFAETLGARVSQVANLRRGRNKAKAILSLVDKPAVKQRQLITY